MFVNLCFGIFVLVLVAFEKSSAARIGHKNTRSFNIDYKHDTFLMDGKPFKFVSGSFHYFRVPHFHWEDRMAKIAAAGLDVIQTYVAWNVHEGEEGIYDFEGQNDLIKFLQLAQKHNLYVLLRPGPYICAEWEYGGFPAWLLSSNETMTVRKMDPNYIRAVDRWFSKLLPLIKPHLYVNGGPIIMVQVENEYGSYFACDKEYMSFLSNLFSNYLGEETQLYTTDGNGLVYLKCGATESAYATVDFGTTGDVKKAFEPMREWNKKGPLVNSELYTGWLDFWGNSHHHGNTKSLINTLEQMEALNASSNMYMFEGGTSFGFMNGADPPNLYQISSYDYDAPLSEAGDITEKYLAIRNFTSRYKRDLPPVPKNTEKGAYGDIEMMRVGSITSLLDILSSYTEVNSFLPLTMEQLHHYYGFVMYRHVFTRNHQNSLLKVPGLRDRGYVLLDKKPIGLLDSSMSTSLILSAEAGQTLDVLVENLGRYNYGSEINDNKKGIISNVTLGGQTLTNWMNYPLQLGNIFGHKAALNFEPTTLKFRSAVESDIPLLNLPSMYIGTFMLPRGEEAKDTFLNMCGWSWGVVYVNGHNLGRYRPKIGPQTTLYLPSGYLKPYPQDNMIMAFELEKVVGIGHQGAKIVSVEKPQLDKTCFHYL